MHIALQHICFNISIRRSTLILGTQEMRVKNKRSLRTTKETNYLLSAKCILVTVIILTPGNKAY